MIAPVQKPIFKKYCVDANVFIELWHVTYPLDVFPTLWDKIKKARSSIILIKPIYNEIDPSYKAALSLKEKKKKYPLKTWLEEHRFTPMSLDQKIAAPALLLRKNIKQRTIPQEQVKMILR